MASDLFQTSISTLGSKSDEVPVKLYHDLYLAPGGQVTVTSDRTVNISTMNNSGWYVGIPGKHWYRWSADPAFSNIATLQGGLTATVKAGSEALVIRPKPDMGDYFTYRWNKLPEELKCLILEHAVVQPSDCQFPGVWEQWPYLYMTPEISRLATEQHYKNNVIELTTGHGHWDNENRYFTSGWPEAPVFRYPPLHLNRFVRFVDITTHLDPEHWVILRYLAAGEYGFPNLKFINIKLDVRSITYDGNHFTPQEHCDRIREWYEPIEFGCQGNVDFDDFENSALSLPGYDILTQEVWNLFWFQI